MTNTFAMKTNPLFDLITKRQNGILTGIPSFCCANKYVIEAILEQSRQSNDKVVIEATSNQVNPFGGYFNMTPMDFRDYVYKIADELSFDRNRIILGGDHLGPQPWQTLPEETAMEYSKELVREAVLAGYLKIHLDTSMHIGNDAVDEPLPYELVASRGAILMKVAETAFQERLETVPDAIHPVFVIGSEVPVPGGALNDGASRVTQSSDFEKTIIAYKKQFAKYGIPDLWDYVIAVVVQPGVEFGDSFIRRYNRKDAFKLTEKLKQYPDIVFEGHSTDYQSPEALKQMVEDGIAIIKVGPALTFAVRQALFALSYMENELIDDVSQRSRFIETLEEEMRADPKDWINYYTGDDRYNHIARKYSYSDRCRYYLCRKGVEDSIEKLFSNLRKVQIPMGMLMQYMPIQYNSVRDGLVRPDPHELVKDAVATVVKEYNSAVQYNHMVGR